MPFEFASPDTLEEAFQLYADGARWYAGGTDVVPEFKAGLADPKRLVNLKRLRDLRDIESALDGTHLGALATLAEIAAHRRIRLEYRALAQACELSASPQIRNVATLGGNLCQDSRCPYYRGDFECYLKGGETCFLREGENRAAAVIGYHDCVHVQPSDPAIALVAFDAEIVATGRAGERTIAAGEFFHAPAGGDLRLNALAPGELVREIRLPNVPGTTSIYLKAMDRATWTFALASVAVRVDFDGERVKDARIVLGGVAPVPWREARVEDLLRGARLDEELAGRAADEVLREARPLSHNAYKRRLARALVKRALLLLRQ
jgi:xanthine dehydrogenase YagS FAD-binding subunit